MYVWDPDQSVPPRVQVERAVGVLMELRGWNSTTARSRLISAAVRADTPVERVAKAILSLFP